MIHLAALPSSFCFRLRFLRRDPPCISPAPTALDRYLAALPAMSLIPVAPFTELSTWQAIDDPPSFDFRRDKGLRRASNEVN